jgi:hypothetical protein
MSCEKPSSCQSSSRRGWSGRGFRRHGQSYRWRRHGRPTEGDILPLARGTSTLGQAHWGSSRVRAGLEAAGVNRTCPVTNLEPEEVMATGQHEVGAVVEWRQGWHVAVTENRESLSTQEASRQILRGLMGPCHVVPCWNDFSSTHSLRKNF